jgi:hypothetical protein
MIEKLLNGACRTRLLYECLDDIVEFEQMLDRVRNMQTTWLSTNVDEWRLFLGNEFDAIVHLLDVLHSTIEQERQSAIMDVYLLLQVYRYSDIELRALR